MQSITWDVDNGYFDRLVQGDHDEISKILSTVQSELLSSIVKEFAKGNDGEETDYV